MGLFIVVYLVFVFLTLIAFGVPRLLEALWSKDGKIRARNRKGFRIALFCLAVVVLALFAAARVNTELDLRAGDNGRFATRQDRRIWLHPSNVSFEIPASWLDRGAEFHNNLHLSHRELRRVRLGYDIANASLPFEDCAAHVGGHRWSDYEGVSSGDMQVRAYVTQLSLDEILARVRKQGFHVAREMGEKDAHITASREQGWEHIEIWYSFLADDYYVARSLNFYIRDIGEYRIVFVFMGGGPEGEMDSILKSIVIPNEQRK